MAARDKTRHRERAIAALLTAPTIAEAAKASGVSVSTLMRWQREPDFKAEIAAVKSQYVTAAIGELQTTALSAVRALRRVLEFPHSSNMELIAAARAILEFCDRFSTAENLDSRLTALEQQSGKVISYGLQGTQETAGESGTTDSDRWSTGFGTENATGRSDSIESEPVELRSEGSKVPGFTRGWISPNSNTLEATQAQANEPSKMPVLIS